MPMPPHLPSRLPEQAALYAQTYDPETGGYCVPPWDEMGRLSREQVDDYRRMIPRERFQYDSVELEVAQLLHGLAQTVGAKLVLETGCARGLSTCFLAAAVGERQGQVVTIDPLSIPHLWDGSDAQDSIRWIAAKSTDCVERVRSIVGDRRFDMLFLDSFHSYPNLMREIAAYEPFLRIGGLIVLHDTHFYDCLAPVIFQLDRNPRFRVMSLESPRTHGGGTRRPGITVCKKISDDRDSHPVSIRADFHSMFGDGEELCLAGRSLSDRPLIDVMLEASPMLDAMACAAARR